MAKTLVVIVMVAILMLGLGGAALASYGGVGSLNVGAGGPSARSSSLHGPSVTGGGPGHGK